MDIEAFAVKIMELMPRIVKGLGGYEHHELSQGKITIPQYWALYHLSRGHLTMKQLAGLLHISPAGATGMIDRLLAQGLVSRAAKPGDRRVILIELTARGKKVIHTINRQRSQSIVKMFSGVSEQDRATYLRIVEQIEESLQKRT